MGTRLTRGPLRGVLLGIGWLALALGLVGVAVPLLPTTPFILLASACFASSSPRARQWLHEHRRFGPALRAWDTERSVQPRHKAVAIIMMWAGILFAVFVVVDSLWLRVALLVPPAIVTAWLLALPNGHAEATSTGPADSAHES